MRRSALLFADDNKPKQWLADFLTDVGIPGTNLVEIDQALQERFFQKKTDGSPKERWELGQVHLTCQPEQLAAYLTACGFISESQPLEKLYNYAAWPGALTPRAIVRLTDLIGAWDSGVRWEQTIVLGGKRELQRQKEGFEQCSTVLGLNQGHPFYEEAVSTWRTMDPQTELQMMAFLWSFAFVKYGQRHGMQNQPVIFVDAPMKPPVKEGGPLIRPNTEDTIKTWLESKPKPGSVLLSSGAPYGMAMDEAFWMLLEPYGFNVETFGHEEPGLPVENLMREVAGAVNRIKRCRIG